MALLAEEVVEEWLNRNGYFTIRGIKVGVDEIDILAIKPTTSGRHECRHIEVQVSINPISYITKVPASIRKLIRTSFLCRGVYLAVSCMSRIFGPQDIGDGSSERIGTVLRASSFYDLIP